MSPDEALIALNMLPRVGPIKTRSLVDYFGSAERVLSASINELQQVKGVGVETADLIHHWESKVDLSRELREVKERGLLVLTQADERYPEPLRNSYDPPVVLYVWGEIKEEDKHAIAIVGSRKTSHYGVQTSRQFGFQLAASGLTIVSGLARGIDTHAHEGAVAARGRTIAVIGSGLGQIYPPENMELANTIASGYGAVVSEFPLNMPPSKKTFPMRNRIVAAWSQAVLVVESPEWSGSQITANLAGEMGKTVYAVPGQIDRPTSAGCNKLIREGATLVTSGKDILDDLEMLPLSDLGREVVAVEQAGAVSKCSFSKQERLVLGALQDNELLIDDLYTKVGVSISELQVILLKLEIKSLVKQIAGGRYTLG